MVKLGGLFFMLDPVLNSIKALECSMLSPGPIVSSLSTIKIALPSPRWQSNAGHRSHSLLILLGLLGTLGVRLLLFVGFCLFLLLRLGHLLCGGGLDVPQGKCWDTKPPVDQASSHMFGKQAQLDSYTQSCFSLYNCSR